MNFKNLLEINYMDNVESCEVYLFDDGNHPIVLATNSIITRSVSKEIYEKFIQKFPDDKDMPTLTQFNTFLASL